MKKKYKIILIIFILEYFCLSLINKLGIRIRTWLGNAIGALVVLLPLWILLYLLNKDKDISPRCRMLAKFFFWFLIFCYIAGGIGKVIALNS